MITEEAIGNNCCAIYSSVVENDNYADYLQIMIQEIDQAISDGYDTFISEARPGVEFHASCYVCGLKMEQPRIKFVLVDPADGRNKIWRPVDEVPFLLENADFIKEESFSSADGDHCSPDQWILDHSKRILCATKNLKAQLGGLKDINLTEKEYYKLCLKRVKEKGEHLPMVIKNDQRERKAIADYPANLICDILGLKYKLNQDILEQFPVDISERVNKAIQSPELDDRERLMLILRYAEGKKLKEVGETAGTTATRAGQIINHAVKKMGSHPLLSILLGVDRYDKVLQELGYTTRILYSQHQEIRMQADRLTEELRKAFEDGDNFSDISLRFGIHPQILREVIQEMAVLPDDFIKAYVYGLDLSKLHSAQT